MQEFWFFSVLPLEEVAERLGGEFGFSDPFFDAENVYQWFKTTTPDGLLLDVSRKHPDDEPDLTEPYRIGASGYQGVDDLGRRLSSCLRTTVYFGEVIYLGGDDFEYNETTRFEHGI